MPKGSFQFMIGRIGNEKNELWRWVFLRFLPNGVKIFSKAVNTLAS